MPHKHRRDKSENSSHYELPPTILAKPLPATKKPLSDLRASSKASKSTRATKPKTNTLADDTPRAFTRLIAFTKGVKTPSGLDDGQPIKSKKRKRSAVEDTEPPQPKPSTFLSGAPRNSDTINASTSQPLRILPGESLKDFSTRVNHLLPISGLVGKSKSGTVPGVKVPQTRKEKKMQRMYAQWREEEKRIRERKEEQEEEAEFDSGEDKVGMSKGAVTGKKGKRSKKAGGEDSDEDPWAELARKKAKMAPSSVGLVGLHDVVQAPPTFAKPLKEKLGIRNGAKVDVKNVPGKSGSETVSLRRREELGEVRRGVLDAYRGLMAGKRERG